MTDSLNRRTMLRSAGATAAAALLAGCSGDGGGSGGGGSDGGDGDSGGGDGGSTPSVPDEASEYLSETSNFDGSIEDMTGQDTITVTVGAEANGGAFGFAPPAVAVSTGTTVEFEWTGAGGNHNVVSEGDGPLDSGSPVGGEGVQYEYTFDSTGTFLYYCAPHKSLGMKGAIVVQ